MQAIPIAHNVKAVSSIQIHSGELSDALLTQPTLTLVFGNFLGHLDDISLSGCSAGKLPPPSNLGDDWFQFQQINPFQFADSVHPSPRRDLSDLRNQA